MTASIRALVITPDQWLLTTFMDISRELGIDAAVSKSREGIPDELRREKYEALLVDFDSINDAAPIVTWIRASPSNKSAVVFAVATGIQQKQNALSHGANFVFERPVGSTDIRRALWASYELLSEERRRYFRFAVEVPVELTTGDGTLLRCRTANVSSDGICILCSHAFGLGESVSVAFTTPAFDTRVVADAVVVWDDRHGKCGIKLQRISPGSRRVLNAWLDLQFTKARSA
jgi:PilZ domain